MRNNNCEILFAIRVKQLFAIRSRSAVVGNKNNNFFLFSSQFRRNRCIAKNVILYIVFDYNRCSQRIFGIFANFSLFMRLSVTLTLLSAGMATIIPMISLHKYFAFGSTLLFSESLQQRDAKNSFMPRSHYFCFELLCFNSKGYTIF